MRSRTIRNTILFQIIFWTLAANLYMIARIVGLAEYDRIKVVARIRYDVAFTQATIAGILVGLLLGVLDIFLVRSLARKHSFGFVVIVKALSYIFSIVIIISLIHLVTDIFIDKYTLSQELQKLNEFYHQEFLLSILIFALVCSFLVSFIKQVNQKFGPGILWPMMLGRYYNPKQEERIFMFLDLRSSTTFAEEIGHVRFSELIQDCFYDLALHVEEYRAEIYQYVGDEALLTWKMKNGIRNGNCLKIFFAFDDELRKRAEYYREKYGLVPEFKAGVNSGMVMVAEVGEIKREIAYHGDVLNTGARIQSQCNLYGKNLLVSESLKNALPEIGEISFERIGDVELKGKKEKVIIYSVDKA